nr:MAG TPA: Replication associated protein [Microviridae sp.]
MKCLEPIWVDNGDRPIQVGCGKCLACLERRRVEWCNRLWWEKRYSTVSYFVTLTYAQKYLPDNYCVRDVQLFIKRLRKTSPMPLRYFLVGERGTKRGRIHYHMLLFNYPYPERIRDAWKLGHVHYGTVTPASIAYVTAYIIQPGKSFRLMSRGYGIGGRYLTDERVDWHRANYCIALRTNGVETVLPRFYTDKIWYKGHPAREYISRMKYRQGEAAEDKAINELRQLYPNDAEQKYRERQLNALLLKRYKTAETQTL